MNGYSQPHSSYAEIKNTSGSLGKGSTTCKLIVDSIQITKILHILLEKRWYSSVVNEMQCNV